MAATGQRVRHFNLHLSPAKPCTLLSESRTRTASGARYLRDVFGTKGATDLTDKLKSLQKKLDKAVADEDFEQAAVVRDEMRTTREKLEMQPSPDL